MCLGLTVPMVLFVGAKLTSRGQKSPSGTKAASEPLRTRLAGVAPEAESPGAAPPRAAAQVDRTRVSPTHASSPANLPKKPSAGRFPPEKQVQAFSPTDLQAAPQSHDAFVVLGPQLELDTTADAELAPNGQNVVSIRQAAARPQLDVVSPREARPAEPDPAAGLSAQLDRISSQLERLTHAVQEPPTNAHLETDRQVQELLWHLRQAQRPQTQTQTQMPGQALPRLFTKIYRPRHLSARTFHALAAPLLTDGIGRIGDSADDAASGSIEQDDPAAPTEAVVVRDTAETLRKIDRLLADLDQPPPQILIETTLLAIATSEAQPNGINLSEFNRAQGAYSIGPAQRAESATADARGLRPGQAPMRLAQGAPVKSGVLRGDVQAFLAAMRSQVSVDRLDAWQTTVLNKQSTQILVRHSGAESGRPGLPSGAMLKVRAVATRDGSIHLDVRPQSTTAPDDAAPTTHPWVHAYHNQFILQEGDTAVFSGSIESGDLSRAQAPPRGLPGSGESPSSASGNRQRLELVVLLTPHALNVPVSPAPISNAGLRQEKVAPAPDRVSAAAPTTRTGSSPKQQTSRKIPASPSPAASGQAPAVEELPAASQQSPPKDR